MTDNRKGSSLLSVEWDWYCRNCQEWLGDPEDEDSNAIICEDAVECPHSVDWEGDACGYVVCRWCHEPATDKVVK